MHSATGHGLPEIPDDVIQDLIGRFMSNIPVVEQSDLIRMCFQVELAHWLFVDKYCTKPGARLSHLAHMPFPTFAAIMFRNTPNLKPHLPFMDYIINNFRDYKQKVPTFGAIILNSEMTHVLLVQGFGNSWGFPKGKVNEDENVIVCAVREVLEETGYDIGDLIRPTHYIETLVKDRKDRLYVVRGADMNFKFKPNTTYEIRQIAWFALADIPESKKDTPSVRGNNFYTVYPYIRRLKKWIADKISGANQLHSFRCPAPPQCQFPFPYPMGYRGRKQASPDETINIISPAQYLSESQMHDPLDEQESLNYVDWTPKNELRNSGFGVPYHSTPQSTSVEPNLPTGPISYTARNPKRRLFVEDIEEGTVLESGKEGHTNNQNFLEGPGASAWLNFKFDVDQILASFSKF